jgi:hypothetical protein
VIKLDNRILHLDPNLPFGPTRPEVLKLTRQLALLIPMLLNVKPAQHTLGRRLLRNDRAPLVSTRQLALTPRAFRERREDQGGVEAQIVDP